ncbi:MAG: hypothetical protein M0R80_14525 [Proteobacteria bacterium]|nr:hypothetical protein [Pseudomonadota bacterium]
MIKLTPPRFIVVLDTIIIYTILNPRFVVRELLAAAPPDLHLVGLVLVGFFADTPFDVQRRTAGAGVDLYFTYGLSILIMELEERILSGQSESGRLPGIHGIDPAEIDAAVRVARVTDTVIVAVGLVGVGVVGAVVRFVRYGIAVAISHCVNVLCDFRFREHGTDAVTIIVSTALATIGTIGMNSDFLPFVIQHSGTRAVTCGVDSIIKMRQGAIRASSIGIRLLVKGISNIRSECHFFHAAIDLCVGMLNDCELFSDVAPGNAYLRVIRPWLRNL